eukprot:scaffold22784_cov34-Tisochrysis_lutea.AAC.3
MSKQGRGIESDHPFPNTRGKGDRDRGSRPNGEGARPKAGGKQKPRERRKSKGEKERGSLGRKPTGGSPPNLALTTAPLSRDRQHASTCTGKC